MEEHRKSFSDIQSEEPSPRKEDPPPPPPLCKGVRKIKTWWRVRPSISREDALRYIKDVRETQGFDVRGYAGTSTGNYISPVDLTKSPAFSECARAAVDIHNRMIVEDNKEEDNEDEEDVEDFIIFSLIGIDRKQEPQCGHVEFIELIKMTANCNGYWFLTLKCLDSDDKKIKTYQAIVEKVPGHDLFLKLFRLKPKSDEGLVERTLTMNSSENAGEAEEEKGEGEEAPVIERPVGLQELQQDEGLVERTERTLSMNSSENVGEAEEEKGEGKEAPVIERPVGLQELRQDEGLVERTLTMNSSENAGLAEEEKGEGEEAPVIERPVGLQGLLQDSEKMYQGGISRVIRAVSYSL